jgi:hypothetical protein
VPALPTIIEKLGRAQSEFLTAADAVPAEHWRRSPEEGRWSAGEVVAHVIMVERAIVRSTDKLLQKPPASLPFFKRWHMPMALVEARLIRRKSPIPFVPELVGPKEELLAQVREVRGRSLAFLEETKERDLGKYHWPHPFLGMLNGYEWFQMIASHQLRHTKQIREIAAVLQKTVRSLQK